MNPEHDPQDEPYEPKHEAPEYEPKHAEPERDPTLGTHAMGALAIEQTRLSEALPSVDWEAVSQIVPPSKLQRAAKLAEFMPTVASVVAHHYNPESPLIRPTAESIRERSVGAQLIHGFLSLFPFGWEDKFDNYLVNRAMGVAGGVAGRIIQAVESIDDTEKPKDELVDEVERLYLQLIGPRDEKASPKRLQHMLRDMYWQSRGQHYGDEPWYSPKSFPLLHGVLTGLGLPSESMSVRRYALKAVTPEVRRGLEMFLEAHGKELVHTPTGHRRKALVRRIAERMARQRLETLPNQLHDTLEQAYKALPETGRGFRHSVQELCQRIAGLSSSGYSAQDITNTLLEDLHTKR